MKKKIVYFLVWLFAVGTLVYRWVDYPKGPTPWICLSFLIFVTVALVYLYLSGENASQESKPMKH